MSEAERAAWETILGRPVAAVYHNVPIIKVEEVPMSMKESRPRYRVRAQTRMLGLGVPDDAQPGDIVVGNRGAAAEVMAHRGVIFLQYIGNYGEIPRRYRTHRRVYDNTGGTFQWA